jgi:hypothetical protein
VPSYRSSRTKRRRGEKKCAGASSKEQCWLIRFHPCPLGRLYGSTYYWMLPPIPTVRASLTCPLPRRSPPPASGSTGTIARSCIPVIRKRRKNRLSRARGWEGFGDGANARSCIVSRRS